MSDKLFLAEFHTRILNLDKLLKLDNGQRKVILDLFQDLCANIKNNDQFGVGFGSADLISAKVIYDSLVQYEYLITKREKSLNQILDE